MLWSIFMCTIYTQVKKEAINKLLSWSMLRVFQHTLTDVFTMVRGIQPTVNMV